MNTPPDDPFAPSDATILRPRPGRRPGTPGAGSAPAAPASSGGPAPTRMPPQGAPRAPSAPEPSNAGSGPGVGEFISTGRNPLLQAAGPLLVLAGRLRGQIANADVES
ncbi:MAG: hypothetical protein ACREVO_02135, partial [Steroidobacteraceae bacterium]